MPAIQRVEAVAMRRGVAILNFAMAVAVIAACGGEQERARPSLTVAQVLARPAELRTASVQGRAFPVGDTQFVLSGRARSIWVFASPAVVRGIRRPGQEVVVRGTVERIEQDQAIELADEVGTSSSARGPPAAARRPAEVLRARRNQHAPYIELHRIAAVAR